MGWDSDTESFTRLWTFVDRYQPDEKINRVDLDAAFADFTGGVNAIYADLKADIDALSNDDLYLGIATSDPTVGSGGAALVVGNVYIKSPEFYLKGYNGSAWLILSPVANASDFFKTLAPLADAAAFRGQLGLGSAALLDSSTLATVSALNAEAALTVNARTLRTTTGTAAAFVMASASPIAAYASGQKFLLRMHATATGAATLNVDGQGAKNLKKLDGTNTKVDVAAGDWVVGTVLAVHYDGTDFVIPKYCLTVGDGQKLLTADAPGTSGQGVVYDADGKLVPANVGWTRAAARDISSGTEFDWTSIPSGMNRVRLTLYLASLDDADHFLVQLGTGGSPAGSGYSGAYSTSANSSNNLINANSSAGFPIYNRGAGQVHNIMFEAERIEGTNIWVATHKGAADTTYAIHGGGAIVLAGALDNLRLTRTASANFDGAGAYAQLSYRA